MRSDIPSLEQVEELYEMLQRKDATGRKRSYQPRLTEKEAYHVIWYLQEYMGILPSTYERCDTCGTLYDSDCTGIYWETKGKFYCGACDYLVPYNYDKGKK